MLGDPFTAAVNCCVPKFATETALGETLTVLATAAVVTVSVAEPVLVLSFCEVAVTVTCGGFGTVAGAV